MKLHRWHLLWFFVVFLILSPASPAQNGQEPLKFPGGTLAIRKLKTAWVEYPEEAKKKRVQGIVSFRAIIGRDGTIQRLTLIDGPPELVHAGEEAVKQWTYEPYVVDGHAMAVQLVLQIVFSLPGERAAAPLWTQEYLRVTPFEMSKRLKTMVDPTRSPKSGTKGLVTLDLVVDASGNVEQAEPVRGPAELFEIARTAVLQWKYTPYLIQGKPAAVITRVVFDFE